MNLHLCQKDYVQMLIEENPLICACHHQRLKDILNILPHHTENSIAEMVTYIQLKTGASTGCGSCLPKVSGMVECHQAKPEIFQYKK